MIPFSVRLIDSHMSEVGDLHICRISRQWVGDRLTTACRLIMRIVAQFLDVDPSPPRDPIPRQAASGSDQLRARNCIRRPYWKEAHCSCRWKGGVT